MAISKSATPTRHIRIDRLDARIEVACNDHSCGAGSTPRHNARKHPRAVHDAAPTMTSTDPIQRRANELIDRAAAAGMFDNLSGRDRPAKPPVENPFVPKELHNAFYTMKAAGVAPSWILLGGEIEKDISRVRNCISTHHRHLGNARILLAVGKAAESAQRFVEFRRIHSQVRSELESQIADISRLIERYNTVSPRCARRFAFWPTSELAAFDACWPWGAPPRGILTD